MILWDGPRSYLLALILAGCAVSSFLRFRCHRRRFDRGRRLSKVTLNAFQFLGHSTLAWGPLRILESEANQHFLAVGATGSGKSLLQRRLMKDVIRRIEPRSDRRALIFDAKGDTAEFLSQFDISCPVFSLNPFQSASDGVQTVAWDVAADITTPARAINLAATLIPSDGKDSNRYFSDAARQVLAGIIESFLRHSPQEWTFTDLVLATESRETIEEILNRDAQGRLVVQNFLGDDRTAYQVFTTLASRMSYFRSVAACWQHVEERISLGQWIQESSVLLLGCNAALQTPLEAINEIVFRVIVEETDNQVDSNSRQTWVWLDEARLSGPLLKSSLLPFLCVKGRSRGVCLVLSFQDLDGFKEAAGERIAHEIIAQCSHKALLRMESPSGTAWASSMIGGYEAVEWFRSRSPLLGRGGNSSEQLTKRDTVLASEFAQIPFTNRRNGLTGYFISPRYGVVRSVVKSADLAKVAPVQNQEAVSTLDSPIKTREPCLAPWTECDRLRLGFRDSDMNRSDDGASWRALPQAMSGLIGKVESSGGAYQEPSRK